MLIHVALAKGQTWLFRECHVFGVTELIRMKCRQSPSLGGKKCSEQFCLLFQGRMAGWNGWAVLTVRKAWIMTSAGTDTEDKACAQSLQSCLTLCDLWTSPAVSSVHASLEVRMLEWVAMPSSRGSSRPTSPVFTGRFFSISATWEALGRHHGLEVISHPKHCLAHLSVLIVNWAVVQ